MFFLKKVRFILRLFIGLGISIFSFQGVLFAQSSFSGDAFEQSVQQQQEEFTQEVQRLEDRWDQIYESSQEDYYVYSSGGRVRQHMNFNDETPEKGFLEIAVVDAKDSKDAEQQLLKFVEKALREKVGLQEILEDQVLVNQTLLTSDNVKQHEEALKQQVQQNIIQTPKGPKTQYSIRLQFTPDHLRRRAQRYAPLVQKYAELYHIPPALIFAVIHTESYFNPRAKSSVAYGLMQLVPKSGARDAYQKVFHTDKIVKPAYLYNPENNIRLGVAYLQVLRETFAKVQGSQERAYLVISAYNTGAGNVSRAFTGSAKLRNAFSQINQFSPEKLYAYLRTHLPYPETRDYLKKVSQRISLYR